MLKNYYSGDLYPSITASEFDEEDKKKAISVFSGCHRALFYYLLVSSIAVLVLTVLLTISQFFVPLPTLEAIINHPVFGPAVQIVCMYFIAFPVYCYMLKDIDRADRDKSTVSFMEFLSLAAISIALMQIGAVIAELAKYYISSSFSLPYEIEMTNKLLKAFDVVPAMLLVIVIGPIFEELVFRKILIDRLSVYGDRLAIIVSSVAFGLHHGNLSQFIYTTIAGIVFGHIYTKTRRIIYPIGLHMLTNLFGTLPTTLYYVEYDAVAESTPDLNAVFNGEITLTYILFVMKIVLILLGILMFLFSFFIKKYRWSRLCDIEIPKSKLLRIVVFNRGTMMFFILCLFTIVISFFEMGI